MLTSLIQTRLTTPLVIFIFLSVSVSTLAEEQPTDRNKGADASKSLAMAGAAMAGLACIMGLREARKMLPGPEKTKAMSQALLQCAQAGQSAAAAGKNDTAKKAVSSEDPTKQPTPSTPQQIQTAKSEDPPFKLDVPPTEDNPLPELSAIPKPGELPEVNFSKKDPSQLTEKEKVEFTGESISALKPIENKEIKYDETSKENTSNLLKESPTAFSFSGTRGISSSELKTSTSSITTGKEGASKRKRSGEDAENEENSGGSDVSLSPAKEEGGNAFDTMLAQLMGGNPGEESNVGISGLDVVVLPNGTKNGRGPNIFEYASYRYRTATYTDSKVQLRATKVVAKMSKH